MSSRDALGTKVGTHWEIFDERIALNLLTGFRSALRRTISCRIAPFLTDPGELRENPTTSRLRNIKIVPIVFACLLGSAVASAVPPGWTASTAPFVGSIEGRRERIPGIAVLTITAANEDDTITGRIDFQFDGAALERLKNRGETVTIDPVTLNFRKGASCPEIRIDARNLRLEHGTLAIGIEKINFVIVETQEPLRQLFCAWTRQINVDRHRLGIIKAINLALAESGKR